METPILQVRNLEIKYHTREGILTAIHNASFEVQRGQIVGVVGESGCGKSTVASAVMRLLPPNGEISNGQILFQGEDLTKLNVEEMRQYRGRNLSMIFQDAMTSLNPVFSIEHQMLDAQRAHLAPDEDGSEKALRKRAVEMLDRIGIPDAADRIKEYPHQFSGGMRQRIMIAMALLSNPSLLVADEPTSALDVTLEAQILELICGLRDDFDTSLLYITHDLGVIAQICDRVIVMYAGNIVEAGDVLPIFEHPKHPYTQALLRSHPSRRMRGKRLRTIPGVVPSLRDLPPGCKFAPRCRLARVICREQEPDYWQVDQQSVLCHSYAPKWKGPNAASTVEEAPSEPRVDAVTGAELEPESKPSESVLIKTSGLHKHFRDNVGLLGQILGQEASTVKAVHGVDVAIRKGETLGLVGESGSGKTTLARTILRLTDPTMGKIVVLGKEISELPDREVRPLRSRMQMIFQDPTSSLSPRMKASSLLMEPYVIHNVPESERKDPEELLAMVGLAPEQLDKYPHQLSGGQARRLGIARALALEPDIIMADEPTAGLDVSVAAGLLNLLKDLRDRLNLTYIIITHNLNVIGFISDRVAVMYLGRIVELADAEALFETPQHPYTEALLSAIPVPDPTARGREDRIILKGEIPSPRNPPSGCPFHPRCRYAEERCREELPELRSLTGNGRLIACHFPNRVRT
jgi:peptide/nickel transport system ATP-binding protein